MKERIKRINELIKEKIAEIILKNFSFGSVLATVQRVETTADLRNAKIWISVIPFEKSKEILRAINNRKSEIQKELGDLVKIKYLPIIEFKIDETEEKADKIDKILKKIKNG